jgi:predicted esterase
VQQRVFTVCSVAMALLLVIGLVPRVSVDRGTIGRGPTAVAAPAEQPRTRQLASSGPSAVPQVEMTLLVPANAEGPAGEALVFSPHLPAEPAPVALMLHGMCSTPRAACPQLAAGLTHWGWLVCPRAALACENGEATWAIDPSRTITRSLERFTDDFADLAVVDERAVLIGFSLGAFRAVQLVQSGKLPWRRLILIGAKVPIDPDKLKRAGVERILLTAGERDAARSAMQSQARMLKARGVAAGFMSFGPIGHELPVDAAERLSAALAWVQGDVSACADCE